ncbi:MAG: hypothetical protein HDS53_03590 [Barnesiella sp.]|nr:hypothetical protein [Barnesiella sp.]
MKLNKFFAVALAVLTLTSCDHDTAEDYPKLLGSVNTTSGVTVSLPATFSANENQIPFNLPIEVTGTTNGKVVVTVETKQLVSVPEGLEPAVEGEHYNITSYTVNIGPEETTGYIEISPVWIQGELNDDRVFEVSITSVQGATVGNKSCEVTIVNVDDPYTATLGKWTLECTTMFTNGDNGPFTVTMSTPDPIKEAEYYGHELYAFGLKGISYIYLPLSYELDEETQKAKLSIMMGTFATTSTINFGFTGVVVTADNYPVPSGFGNDIELTYGVDEEAGIEYYEAPADAKCVLAVMPYPALNQVAGAWDGWTGIRLTRKLK